MRVLLIEGRYKGKITLTDELIRVLPKKIGLVASIQFVGFLPFIKKELIRHKITSYIGKGKQPYAGQVLGCDVSPALKIDDEVQAFLSISTGEFHSLGIAMKTEKPVIIYDPITKITNKITKSDIEIYKKRKKGAYLKFMNSDIIGLLVSTKPGQNNIKTAFKVKEKLKDKKCYIFVSDEIDMGKLADFNFVQCWVNLACPRIDDKGMLNIEDIKDIILK